MSERSDDWFVTSETPGGRIAFEGCEVRVGHHDVGESRENHVHREDHVVLVRSGRMRWAVDGIEREIGPGDAIITPGGVPHRYEVLGDEPATVIRVIAPPETESDADRDADRD